MDFLDYLSEFLSCQYVSDLRYISITAEQAKALLSLPINQFQLKHYQEAAHYLLGNRTPYQDSVQARKDVIDHLLNQR